jgi:hypothetical protein
MKRLYALALATLASSLFYAGDTPICRASPPVLRNGEVPFGSLGHPLGSYLTIEGVRVEKGKVGIRTLLVDTVNGKKLEKPVVIWIDNADLPPTFHCAIKGYEMVGMIGTPPAVMQAESDAGREVKLPQAVWQAHLYFVALSDVALSNAVLKEDPAAALRSSLPEGWAVLRVEEGAYPRDLPKGKGTAIYLRPPHSNEEDVVIYVMPADYKENVQPKDRTARTGLVRLLATVPTARIYVWERFGQLSGPGWAKMWDDIPEALLREESRR